MAMKDFLKRFFDDEDPSLRLRMIFGVAMAFLGVGVLRMCFCFLGAFIQLINYVTGHKQMELKPTLWEGFESSLLFIIAGLSAGLLTHAVGVLYEKQKK